VGSDHRLLVLKTVAGDWMPMPAGRGAGRRGVNEREHTVGLETRVSVGLHYKIGSVIEREKKEESNRLRGHSGHWGRQKGSQ